MNIVDIVYVVCKYSNGVNKRHITCANNISFWIAIDEKYINNNIITKYSSLLNKANVKIILKCIKFGIKIMPKFYYLTNNDINMLINESFMWHNLNMIKTINNYMTIIKDNILTDVKYVTCVGQLKLLHKYGKLISPNFPDAGRYCQLMAVYNRLECVKYLHKIHKFTSRHFESINNFMCEIICSRGFYDMVKYMHQEIGLTSNNFQSTGHNYSCELACQNGHIKIVKYLYENIGLSMDDFRSQNNNALKSSCLRGHIEIVKYLHKNIGLTKEDFQSNNNEAYQYAQENNRIEIIEYINQYVLFN